jgi:signal transduction histidine kinase/CheY-like chemotaxis protein
VQNEEFDFLMKSGEIRTWLFSLEPITIGGEPCLIGVSLDITERKEMENELREAMKRADAANRAKSEFLARMSHEIRTPIHGVMGTLDLLGDTELGQEQRQYVSMSKASAETLLNVINEILDFSKIEAGKLVLESKEFELHTMLEEALETVAVPAHRKGLEVILQVSDGVPGALIGDEGRLRQVLINLLGNAVKFTTQGEIVLRVEVETVDEKEAALHFSIRDTGIGIPREKQEILFQPFEQVDGSDQRKYGGTGLGLSICKQLVALMGGHTWFKSWPGEGSVFHFIVRFKKQDVSAPPVNAPEIAPELRGTQLLLVDDNATCRSILRNQLVEWGFQVTEAESGHAAIKELEDARGTARKYSIILLDKEMPAMDGLATTRQILQNSAQNYSIVMMLPSNNISNDFASGQELGISHYLIKPVKKSELLKIVLKALGEGKNEKEPDEKAIQQHSDGYASHLNVLVAEDNATSQLIVKKILEKAGHNVQIAITGIESIRMLKEGKYDLVLMDVEMPEMSGLEATRIIRKTETGSNRHIPIIAMTAYAMKEDRQRCLDAGMDTYLSKPVNVEELHKVIRGLSSKRNNGSSIVDIDAALKFVGGDKEILKEVVRVFVQDDYPKQLRNLKDGISRHDAEAVKAAAHSIKGAVRSIGSMPTGNIALRLEEMGRNNNLTGAEAALQELEQGVTNVKEYYEQYNGPKAQ